MATRAEQLESAQKALDAAVTALETEAGSGIVSITVGGETQSFSSREETLAFINLMEKRVAFLRKRPPLFRTVGLNFKAQ